MTEFRVTSVAEQAADFLRTQVLRGRWGGEMPGRHQLAAELGINHKTVDVALRQLEAEGLIHRRGSGRHRKINPPDKKTKVASMRIGIVCGMSGDRMQEFMVATKHRLIECGHSPFYTEFFLHDLGMDVGRIARMIRKIEADAWIVVGGTQDILEWFAAQSTPAFAFFGRRRKLRMAGGGPDKPSAYAAATRKLVELGHRRIVLLAHALRRMPEPGESERAFLAELASLGITPGAFHLPDWEETPDGLHTRLESLFQLTPPTAIIADTVQIFCAVEEFLARNGLRVPDDVSLICGDESIAFLLRKAPVSCIRWDSRKIVRRVVNWAAKVSRGQEDVSQLDIHTDFVDGGTIGPACKMTAARAKRGLPTDENPASLGA